MDRIGIRTFRQIQHGFKLMLVERDKVVGGPMGRTGPSRRQNDDCGVAVTADRPSFPLYIHVGLAEASKVKGSSLPC
jgi:hypothetical protein